MTFLKQFDHLTPTKVLKKKLFPRACDAKLYFLFVTVLLNALSNVLIKINILIVLAVWC